MKIFMRSMLSVLLVTLVSYHSAHARIDAVPEIDPAMGMGALALLGAGVMVIRGRRKV